MHQQGVLTELPMSVLYQRYAPAIFAYIQHHTNTREDAEDVLVDVFLAALEDKKFATLNERDQVAWLRRVARNKVVDSFRRSNRQVQVTLESVAESLFEDDEQAPEHVTLQNDAYARLQVAMKDLPKLQQNVLEMRFTQGLPCAEIAARIGKREGAVRVLLSRTLNLLRTIYIKQEEGKS